MSQTPAPNQTFNVGQTIKLHVKAIKIDGSTEDTTIPLMLTGGNPSFFSQTVDGTDPRQVNLVAIAPGSAFMFIDQNPACPSSGKLQVLVTVTAPPPDLRRVDFVSAEAPTP